MTAATTAYIAVADLRSASKVWPDLELPGAAGTAVTDANVLAGITAASALIAAYCGDDFGAGSTAATHLIDGTGGDTLLLDRRFWYGSVTGVEERADDNSYSTLDTTTYRARGSLNSTGTGFQAGSSYDAIESLGTLTWTKGVLNYRVTAKWGWDSPPWAIQRACALITYDMLAGKNAGIHRAISWQTPQANYERARGVVMGLPEVADLLEPYVFQATMLTGA